MGQDFQLYKNLMSDLEGEAEDKYSYLCFTYHTLAFGLPPNTLVYWQRSRSIQFEFLPGYPPSRLEIFYELSNLQYFHIDYGYPPNPFLFIMHIILNFFEEFNVAATLY
jgi:hypothetical protein